MPAGLSIVIPTFNRCDLLSFAIDSALAQSLACEVVVVDHGSTDATPEIAARYGERIQYIRRDRDDGPFLCWLDGALRCHGEYVNFTFDDDWLSPEFAATLLPHFDDDVGVVLANAYIVFVQNEQLLGRLHTTLPGEGGRYPAMTMLNHLMERPLTITPGCAIFRRRDVLDTLMMNPVAHHHRYRGAGPDLMMYLGTLQRYAACVHVASPLTYLREHAQSITSEAIADPAKQNALYNTYNQYKYFYLTQMMSHQFANGDLGEQVKFLGKLVKP